MEYDSRHQVKRKHGSIATSTSSSANGDSYHITVPPSMKDEFSAQRSRQEDQRVSQQLQEVR